MMEIESIGKASGMVYGRYIYFFLLFLPHLPFSSMEGRSNITSANKIYIVAKPPCQHLEKHTKMDIGPYWQLVEPTETDIFTAEQKVTKLQWNTPHFFMWYELCSKTFNADHAQFKGYVNVIAKLSVISSRNRSSSNIIPIDLEMKICYVSVCTLYLRQNKLQFKINHQSRSTKVFWLWNSKVWNKF